jgi:hypothetical protein
MHGELSDEPILAPVASALQQNKAEATDWSQRRMKGEIKKGAEFHGALFELRL